MLPLPSLQTVLTLIVGPVPGSVQRVAEQLTTLYAPVLGTRTATRWAESSLCRATILVTGTGLPQVLPDSIVAGPAARGTGLRANGGLDRLFDDPSRSTLDGPFVAVRCGKNRVDLITAASGVRPLHRLRGKTVDVWSTKALAAHIAAGERPRISIDAVPDVILLDYVLGDDDLLVATTVPADALHVRATSAGVEETHWSTLADRFAPGPPTDAVALRGVLGQEMARVARIPGASLGLTAGRDSTLALSCLPHESGSISTFTFGWPGDGDAEGAAAAAAAAGCPHRLVASRVHDGSDGRWARAASRWTEGQVSARNLLIDGFDWEARGVTWVTGSGGEIGRAFYGQYFTTGGSPPDRWRSFFVERHRRVLRGPVLNGFEDRVGREMAEAWSIRPQPVGAADVFYYANRMGKWFNRMAYIEPITERYPVYLAGPVARSLLDIPETDRLSGRTFDEALSAGSTNLHRVARHAVSERFGQPSEDVVRRWSLPTDRLPRRVRAMVRGGVARMKGLRSQASHPEWALLGPLCRRIDVDGSLVIDVMGGRWWRSQLASAPRLSGDEARRTLWNAVAVDAFHRELPLLPGP